MQLWLSWYFWSRLEKKNEIPWRPCSCILAHLDHAFATLYCQCDPMTPMFVFVGSLWLYVCHSRLSSFDSSLWITNLFPVNHHIWSRGRSQQSSTLIIDLARVWLPILIMRLPLSIVNATLLRLCSCLSDHFDYTFATLDYRHSTHPHGSHIYFLSIITFVPHSSLCYFLLSVWEGVQGLFDEDPYRLCSHTHMVLSIRSAASFGIKIGISWYTRATIINYSCSIEYDYRV